MDRIAIIEDGIINLLRDAAAKAIQQGHPPGCCCSIGDLREPLLFFRVAEANSSTAFAFDEFGAAMDLLVEHMKIATCEKDGEKYVSLNLQNELWNLIDRPRGKVTQ